MTGVRIVIGLRRPQALERRRKLNGVEGSRIVGSAYSELALFKRVRRELSVFPQPTEPIIVLTSSFDSCDAQPMCTRLLDEYPELVVYELREKSITRYSRLIQVKRMTTDEFLADLSS